MDTQVEFCVGTDTNVEKSLRLFPWGWKKIQILCGDHPHASPRIPTQYFCVGMRGAMRGAGLRGSVRQGCINMSLAKWHAKIGQNERFQKSYVLHRLKMVQIVKLIGYNGRIWKFFHTNSSVCALFSLFQKKNQKKQTIIS